MTSSGEVSRCFVDTSSQPQPGQTKHENQDDGKPVPTSSIGLSVALAATNCPHGSSIDKNEHKSIAHVDYDSAPFQLTNESSMIEDLESSLGRIPTARDVIIARLKDRWEHSRTSDDDSSETSMFPRGAFYLKDSSPGFRDRLQSTENHSVFLRRYTLLLYTVASMLICFICYRLFISEKISGGQVRRTRHQSAVSRTPSEFGRRTENFISLPDSLCVSISHSGLLSFSSESPDEDAQWVSHLYSALAQDGLSSDRGDHDYDDDVRPTVKEYFKRLEEIVNTPLELPHRNASYGFGSWALSANITINFVLSFVEHHRHNHHHHHHQHHRHGGHDVQLVFLERLVDIVDILLRYTVQALLIPFICFHLCCWIRFRKFDRVGATSSSSVERREDCIPTETGDEKLQSLRPTTLTDLSVKSVPYYLDIIEAYGREDIKHLCYELESLRSRFRDPLPPFHYKAIVRGGIPVPGFVCDASGKTWHQLATSHFVIFYSGALDFDQISTTAEDGDSSGDERVSQDEAVSEDGDSSEDESIHQNNAVSEDECRSRFRDLFLLSIKSILLTSAGVRNPTSDPSYNTSVRSIIALQTIREMLHWRHVFRKVLSELPVGTKCVIKTIGEFSVAEQLQLCHQGNTTPEVCWLDPSNWKDVADHALGLLAWVNVSTTAIHEPAQLLQSIDVTSCKSADWVRVSLQFGAGRDVDQAIAFVDLIRFLVIRHHVPAAVDPSLCCANQFLDRAVAIPELEACLPEILNLQSIYRTGHDIDTGAITTVDLLTGNEFQTMSGAGADSISFQELTVEKGGECVTSGIGMRGLPCARDRRVVLSVWTSPVTGSEWKIPQKLVSRVDFTLKKVKYQLSVRNGEVTCKRVGRLKRLKNQLRGITQIQTPFLSIQRESSRSRTPEASGSVAITNALSLEYGEEACRHMLAWLHRGVVNISPNCTAASFVPKSSHLNHVVVNQRLGYEICRQMVFGRKGHELYWLPGDGLPSFRVRDCPNGTYKVTETDQLPPGVELCRAELTKSFG